MTRILPTLTGIILACVAGHVIGRLRIGAYWQSLGAFALGWVLASTTLAASWLMWPPADVDVLAVSVGLAEAGLAAALGLVIGSAIHFLLAWAATALPILGTYRTVLMGLVGAAVAAATFRMGMGGIQPVV